jgi:cobalt-zinc-cadmium efflux system outer membrane protein
MKSRIAALTLGLAVLGQLAPARAEDLDMEKAVSLALERNHDVIAARLALQATQFDKVEAGMYPNPIFSYSLGNLVLGRANPQGPPAIASPGFFGQTVHTIAISEVVDFWGKRSARLRAAGRSIEHEQLLERDALREVVYAVRSAFADVIRKQSERALSHETRERYDETVRLSRSRYSAGDISEAELRKIELEGLRYKNAEIDSDLALELSRQQLAELLAMGGTEALPGTLSEQELRLPSYAVSVLVDRALTQRPDVLAAKQAKWLTEAMLARARREAMPDIALGLQYTHSEFTASGDNPNALGLAVSLPLPLFDRNQANIGRAQVDQLRAQNEGQRLVLEIKHEVGDAFRRIGRGQALLEVFEGGMLDRADQALKVAENSYRAGGISLIELLEAQRTYLQTRAEYLRAVYDYRQAAIDLKHAVGGELP